MRKLLSIALVIFFMTSIVAKDITSLSWDIWYVVNKNYVATQLCENRANPMMQCNGKCFLSKQLKKAEGELEKKMPQRTLKLKALDWVQLSGTPALTAENVSFPVGQSVHWPDIEAPTVAYAGSVFHPPTA